MKPRRPFRLRSFDYMGPHRYFLTLCTFGRHRPFEQPQRVAMVREQFLRTAAEERFEILAYCFMPDHVHLLVEGTAESADLQRFVKVAKQRSGFLHRRHYGQFLWQEGYHDRVLRNDEQTIDVVRYIISNPVREGLVKSVADYPFSGSERIAIEALVEDVQTRA